MDKNKIKWIAGLLCKLIFAVAVFSACSGNHDKAVTGTLDTVAVADNNNADKPENARYGIRSGIIKFKSTTMMMDQNVVIYFDDWGIKQRSEITMELLGQKVNNVTLIVADTVYNIDLIKKTGTFVPFDRSSADNVNFLSLTDEIRKKFSIKEEGKEDVIGRPCIVYSINDNRTGMSGKYYIWNGITLKTQAKVSGFEIKMAATEMVENAIIPADKFTLPQGIKLKNLNVKSVVNH